MSAIEIDIRECTTLEELTACVHLQKQVFATPDLEVSPARHLIVNRHAGGFTLGAFAAGGELIGFVLTLPMFLAGEERGFYSHMTAVAPALQNLKIGARLKWAQRQRALAEGVRYIKWTYQPVQARNAFFNLERLGATVNTYAPNFYGTDYSTSAAQNAVIGLDSDRLFADWQLDSPKTNRLAEGENFVETDAPEREIEIPHDWNRLIKTDPSRAVAEQTRIKLEFQAAFAEGLTAKSFARGDDGGAHPKYLLYKEQSIL